MNSAPISRILTLVFTDLVDSTVLKMRLGDLRVADLIRRHRAVVSSLAAESAGRIIDWAGDGCFLTFETPSAAAGFTLHLQRAHANDPDLPQVRVGMHMGEVSETPIPDGTAPRVEGMAVDLTARICGLASPGQILMSAAVADSARLRLDTSVFSKTVTWRSHGTYRLKGFDEVVQIREVGFDGVAPFASPAASDKARPVNPEESNTGRGRLLGVAFGLLVLAAGAVTWLLWPQAKVRQASEPDRAEATEPTARSAVAADFDDRPAIAVLPFDNLSDDPEQAYFADGLAEDLITRLSLFRSFPVIARNSSFVFKGKAVDIKAVGADLGVRYVVEGSVRRSGDRIRIVAQLIDAASGQHVWAETYDRELTDVFNVQDEISENIAVSLLGDLQRMEQARVAHRDPENLQAWGLYQRALSLIYRSENPADVAEAVTLLERAVVLDPGLVPARAKLAEATLRPIFQGWTDTAEADVERALGEARRAVEIDPRDASARISLAWALFTKGELGRAAEEAQLSLELNPSEIMALASLPYIASASGQSPEAGIALIERGMRLSPHDPLEFVFLDSLSMTYFCAGRFAEGVATARRLIALRPGYIQGYFYAAINAAELGHVDEAREFVRQAKTVHAHFSLDLARRIYGGMAPDVERRFYAALRKAGLE